MIYILYIYTYIQTIYRRTKPRAGGIYIYTYNIHIYHIYTHNIYYTYIHIYTNHTFGSLTHCAPSTKILYAFWVYMYTHIHKYVSYEYRYIVQTHYFHTAHKPYTLSTERALKYYEHSSHMNKSSHAWGRVMSLICIRTTHFLCGPAQNLFSPFYFENRKKVPIFFDGCDDKRTGDSKRFVRLAMLGVIQVRVRWDCGSVAEI